MRVTLSSEDLDGGGRQINLSGILDAPGTMEIEEQFRGLIDGQGPVIVNLDGLDYMSSYGLRLLLVSARKVHERGSTLHLAAPNDRVMQLIQIAGYDTLFPVHATIAEAVAALKE
ncbi:MAG: hypothetical protein Kow00124_18990 [Anaerolineae bacterium]